MQAAVQELPERGQSLFFKDVWLFQTWQSNHTRYIPFGEYRNHEAEDFYHNMIHCFVHWSFHQYEGRAMIWKVYGHDGDLTDVQLCDME